MANLNDFDALAMYEAMDAQRIERGLSWRQVAGQMWDQSADLVVGTHLVIALAGVASSGS